MDSSGLSFIINYLFTARKLQLNLAASPDSMAGHEGALEELKSQLARLLPDSIQVFNLVTLALSGDGIARQVIARHEGGGRVDGLDTLAVIIINKVESPKESISLYYNTLGAGNMKNLLVENVDLEREITFAVSLKLLFPSKKIFRINC